MFNKSICTIVLLMTVVGFVDFSQAAARRRRSSRSSSRSRQIKKVQSMMKKQQEQYKKAMIEYQKYQQQVYQQQQQIAAERAAKRKQSLKIRADKKEASRKKRMENRSGLKTNKTRSSKVVAEKLVLPSKVKQLIKKQDANNNGSLSKSEAKGSLFEKQFDTLDKNKDGKLTLKESYGLKTKVDTHKINQPKLLKFSTSTVKSDDKKTASKKSLVP